MFVIKKFSKFLKSMPSGIFYIGEKLSFRKDLFLDQNILKKIHISLIDTEYYPLWILMKIIPCWKEEKNLRYYLVGVFLQN